MWLVAARERPALPRATPSSRRPLRRALVRRRNAAAFSRVLSVWRSAAPVIMARRNTFNEQMPAVAPEAGVDCSGAAHIYRRVHVRLVRRKTLEGLQAENLRSLQKLVSRGGPAFAWGTARRVRAPDPPSNTRESRVQNKRETLRATAGGLLLPCALIDMVFDTDFLSIAAQTMLAAFACALMLVVWTGQE